MNLKPMQLTTKVWSKIWNKTGFKCPNCQTGDVVEKKTRGRGHKVFYACNRFPDCTFIMNKKPESQADIDAAFEYWKANPPEQKAKKGKAHHARKKKVQADPVAQTA